MEDGSEGYSLRAGRRVRSCCWMRYHENLKPGNEMGQKEYAS